MTSKPQPQSANRLRDAIGEQAIPCIEQPDLFFEPDGDNNNRELPAAKEMRERAARSLCLSCPARQMCLELARLEMPAYGIWGGLTAEEITNTLKGAA